MPRDRVSEIKLDTTIRLEAPASPWLTATEAADWLGIGKPVFDALVEMKKFRRPRLGGRYPKWSRKDVAFMAYQLEEAEAFGWDQQDTTQEEPEKKGKGA